MIPKSLAALVLLLPSLTGAAYAASSPVGRWTAIEIAGQAPARGVASTLEITAEGGVSGRGGCNRYSGTARIGPATIAFGPLRSTMMACDGPGMGQERRFHAALSRAAAWRIEGDRLVLVDAAGQTVLRLGRGR